MKIRVRLDLILNSDEETLANKIYDTLLSNLKDHAQVIKKGLVDEETSSLRIKECYHDETPTKPCKILKEIHK